MKTNLNFKDFDRNTYEESHWYREQTNETLEGKIIINVETKKDFIRVWFKED